MDPFEALAQGATAYGQQQARTSPYNIITGVGQSLPRVTQNAFYRQDPWSAAILNIGGGLAQGFGTQAAQHVATQSANQAYDVLGGKLQAGDFSPVQGELGPTWNNVRSAVASDRLKQVREREKEDRSDIRAQKRFLFEGIINDAASPEAARARAYGYDRPNIFSNAYQGIFGGPGDRQAEVAARKEIEQTQAPVAGDVISSLTNEATQAPTNSGAITYQAALEQAGGNPAVADDIFGRAQDREDSRFTREQALKDDFTREAQVFRASNIGFRSLLNAAKDPHATSDLELIRGAIQAIEPGMAVREGEAAAAEGSTSLFGRWAGDVRKAISGESSLTKDARDGILRIAARRYEQHARDYSNLRDQVTNSATNYGLNPENVLVFPPAEEVSALYPEYGQNSYLAEARKRGLVK